MTEYDSSPHQQRHENLEWVSPADGTLSRELETGDELPLVSIITPNYNHLEFLEDTILSVIRQDYPSIEYIVVDGGSTDGSIDIIRRYEKHISKWISEPDTGQSDAINKGFRMAKGEIVAWLNSDDMYMPGAISTAVASFKKNPAITCFYGNAVFINRQGSFIRYFTEVEPFDEFRLRNCSDFIMQPTTFFRRDKLSDMGFLDESLHFTMDYDLWCRFAKDNGQFHYEKRLIAANREYGGTKTRDGGRKRLKEIAHTLRNHKTSIWPHGYFSYLRCFWLEYLAENPSPAKRLLHLLVHYVTGALCFKNYIYARTHNQDLGGLQAHSDACRQNVRLCIPSCRVTSGLHLSLMCPFVQARNRKQEVRITINGHPARNFEFKGDLLRQDIVLDYPALLDNNDKVEVELEFKHIYRSRRANAGISAYVLGLVPLHSGEAKGPKKGCPV